MFNLKRGNESGEERCASLGCIHASPRASKKPLTGKLKLKEWGSVKQKRRYSSSSYPKGRETNSQKQAPLSEGAQQGTGGAGKKKEFTGHKRDRLPLGGSWGENILEMKGLTGGKGKT